MLLMTSVKYVIAVIQIVTESWNIVYGSNVDVGGRTTRLTRLPVP